MSKDEFIRLVDDVRKDAALRAEFAKVRDTPEKWVALANQKGYDISLERAKAYEELSDADLEKAAGGNQHIVIEYGF